MPPPAAPAAAAASAPDAQRPARRRHACALPASCHASRLCRITTPRSMRCRWQAGDMVEQS